MRHVVGSCLVALLLIAGSGRPAAGQQPVPDQEALNARAKDLYLTGAYENALTLLRDATTSRGRILEVLCLTALARDPEAEQVLEALVRSDPSFVPTDTDIPPRVRQVVDDVRRRVLPELARERFVAARAAYDADAHAEALRHFQAVLVLLEDPVLEGVAATADLRLLSTSFADLAREAIARAEAEAAAEAARLEEAARLAALAARPPRITDPIALERTIPPWPASAESSGGTVGRLRLTIDTDGRVTAAAMETSIHPQYDSRLITAAYTWRYEPATRDGVPIAVEHLVEVRVSP